MKPLAIALSGAGRRLKGADGGSGLTNVHCKPIWNCHNESSLYKKCILINMKRKFGFVSSSSLLLSLQVNIPHLKSEMFFFWSILDFRFSD
jgi:hypothetical protein